MSVPDRASPRSDAMPTTRGSNFYLADPNLEFVCATVMTAEELARARVRTWWPWARSPAASWTRWPPWPTSCPMSLTDAYPLYVKRWLRPPPAPASALTARECEWLDAIVDWAPTPAEALAAVTGGPS
jgi:hypothetical protein